MKDIMAQMYTKETVKDASLNCNIPVLEYLNFQLICDAQPRPHYILKSKNSKFKRHQLLLTINKVLDFLKLENPTMSIHLGQYRTRDNFHLHFISNNISVFRQTWIDKYKLGNVKFLDEYPQRLHRKSQRYKTTDINSLRKNLPVNDDRSASFLKTFVESGLCFFDTNRPIIHLTHSSSLDKIYSILLNMADQLNLDSRDKKRGGHLCMQKIDRGEFKGYLLIDVKTFYSLHSKPTEWLNNFENNQSYMVET